jgi:WD40 repeat protein
MNQKMILRFFLAIIFLTISLFGCRLPKSPDTYVPTVEPTITRNAPSSEYQHPFLKEAFMHPYGGTIELDWSHDGKYLLSYQTLMVIWDMQTRSKSEFFYECYLRDSVKWSPNDQYLAVNCKNKLQFLMASSPFDILEEIPIVKDAISGIVWVDNTKILGAMENSRSLQSFSLDGIITEVSLPHSINDIYTEPNSEFIIGWGDGKVYYIVREDYQFLQIHPCYPITRFNVAMENYLLACQNISRDKLMIVDLSERDRKPIELCATEVVNVLRWANNERYLVYCDVYSRCQIWDIPQKHLVWEIDFAEPVVDVSWSPGDDYLAISHYNGEIRIWNFRSILLEFQE